MRDATVPDLPEYTPRPAGAPLALEGIRVVDFTHFLAGPFATLIMADMGADVIKVEAPGRGEEFRHFAPVLPGLPARGAPFVWGNRNKRSIAIDMKSDQGLAVVRDLVAGADVLIENFSTGVMDRFGLGYPACRQLNPRLVYCSVSAYGRDGAFADRAGFDPVAQAESGFMDMNGHPDGDGVRTQSPVVDIHTATMACNAILGALLARGRTGQGQFIDTTLFDNAVLMTGYAAMQHLMGGADVRRQGNISADSSPTGVFRAEDRSFYMMCSNDRTFQRLALQVLERPGLASDPTLADRSSRLKRREELVALLNGLFAEHPWAYWAPRMRAAAIPCGEVRTVPEALRSPEARARELVTRIPQADVGWLPNIALPFKYSGTPLADPRPAPAVGEHTDDVLGTTLGYPAERIAALRRSGAVA